MLAEERVWAAALMASPPRPPVRRTSRLGTIPTPHAPGAKL